MATTRIARKGGTVRLTLSSRVANDLASLQKSLKVVAERLGHPACATGCDILALGEEQEFVIAAAADLNPQPLPPRALSFEQGRGQITVTIPDKVSGNIDSLTKSVETVLGKLGCGQCCSGFDILFRREINTIALDEKGGIAHFGGLA